MSNTRSLKKTLIIIAIYVVLLSAITGIVYLVFNYPLGMLYVGVGSVILAISLLIWELAKSIYESYTEE